MTVSQCNVDFLETCPLPHFWKKENVASFGGRRWCLRIWHILPPLEIFQKIIRFGKAGLPLLRHSIMIFFTLIEL